MMMNVKKQLFINWNYVFAFVLSTIGVYIDLLTIFYVKFDLI